MKNLMAKLKGLKFKALLVEHGEKIIGGMVGLFALLIVLTTPWSGIQKRPDELVQAAKESNDNLDKHDWPADKRAEFLPATFFQKAEQLAAARTEVTPFTFSTTYWTPLYPVKELIREPELLAVQDLRADAGRTVVAKATAPPPEEAQTEGEEAAEEDDPNTPDEIKAREEGAGGPGRAGGGPAGLDRGPMGKAGRGDIMAGAAMGAAGSEIEPRGLRFVAVRGIFPLRKQMEAFQRAIHLENVMDAMELVDFWDFEIQRQRALPGDPEKRWTGEWETVSIELTEQILNEVADFDIDEVDSGLIDQVFTCPLPKRILGYWGPLATHPAVKNFELSPEEKEAERKMNEFILEKVEQQEVPQKGGFARNQVNIGQARSRFFNQATQEDRSMLMERSGMPGAGGPGGRMGGPQAAGMGGMGPRAGMEARMAAVGRLLLFRFFDFDVEPGQAYRYKVRLKMANPNAGRQVAEVVDPSVIANEFRETPWSEPSTPAVVPPDVNYFLADVDHRSPKQGNAEVEIFEWNSKLGTYMQAKISNALGQILGGKVKTRVLDVAKETLEEVEETFRTETVLVDTEQSPMIVIGEHPDLSLPAKTTSRPETIGVADQALTVNKYGQIELLDSESQKSEARIWQSWIIRQNRPFEDQEEAGGTDSRLDTGKAAKGAGGPMAKGAGGPGEGQNPIKRSGRRGRGTEEAMGPGTTTGGPGARGGRRGR